MSRLVQNGTVTSSTTIRRSRGGRVAAHHASGRPAAMHTSVAAPACSAERRKMTR